ncbi:MAG TPA: hypothetical protein QGF58_21360 [Myxococcota bacterium]|nr:hypothetical protein [Myxococcota bacterium]
MNDLVQTRAELITGSRTSWALSTALVGGVASAAVIAAASFVALAHC